MNPCDQVTAELSELVDGRAAAARLPSCLTASALHGADQEIDR